MDIDLLPALALREPLWLLLLPLALLPWWRRAQAAEEVAHLAWLPLDPLGARIEALLRLLASLSLAFTLLGLAAPERPEARVERTGRGAEIALLLDRSSSMDEAIRHNGRDVSTASREPKAASMRKALADFIARRPNDRYALVMFAAAPLRVLPFTEDVAAVEAALAAAGIGRGLTETDIGRALLAGIEAFDGRAYTGSRVILLVSDGGAVLSPQVEARVRAGLARNRISLYFIYIRSATNSPDLERSEVGPIEASTPEWVLHGFFKSLATPYRVFQAKDPGSIAAAVAAVDRQQNLPLTWYERVPRVDWRSPCFVLAALASALMAMLGTEGAWRRRAPQARAA